MFLRLLLLVFSMVWISSGAITVRTLTHGDWENPACWSNAQIPANPDTILVRHYMVIHQSVIINSPTILFIENTGTICGDYLLETGCGAAFINYGHMYLNQIKTRLGTNYWVIECKNSILISGCPSPTAGFQSMPPNGSVKVWPPVLCRTPDTNWEGGTSTGLSGLENSGLHIYPNPVNDQLIIIAPGYIRLRLTNSPGEEIETRIFENKADIDLSKLPPGIYFLELEADGRKMVRKIIRI